MPVITFTVQDIGGSKMDPKEVEVFFEPNDVLIGAAAPRMGFLYPTEPKAFKPDPSTGVVEALLGDTSLMLGDAYYRLRIKWLGAEAGTALMDFPNWKIRPLGNDAFLSEIIDEGADGGGANPNIWWVSADQEPPSRNYTWLVADPDDPDRETAGLPNAVIGDVKKWS